MSFCETCGQELTEKDEFCNKCGSPNLESETSDESKTIFCEKCGEKISKFDLFCEVCGKKNSLSMLQAPEPKLNRTYKFAFATLTVLVFILSFQYYKTDKKLSQTESELSDVESSLSSARSSLSSARSNLSSANQSIQRANSQYFLKSYGYCDTSSLSDGGFSKYCSIVCENGNGDRTTIHLTAMNYEGKGIYYNGTYGSSPSFDLLARKACSRL